MAEKKTNRYFVLRKSADKFLLNSTIENRTGIKACQFMTKTLQATESGKDIKLVKIALGVDGKKCIKIVLKSGKNDCVSIPDTDGKTVMDGIISYWMSRKEE
jgi:hypothetical protein